MASTTGVDASTVVDSSTVMDCWTRAASGTNTGAFTKLAKLDLTGRARTLFAFGLSAGVVAAVPRKANSSLLCDEVLVLDDGEILVSTTGGIWTADGADILAVIRAALFGVGAR